MDAQPSMLILLPLAAFIMAFIAAWALASWRAQRNNQQLHTDLELSRTSVSQLQTELTEHRTSLAVLTQQKTAQDISMGRLETERDSSRQQQERLELDIVAHKADLKAAQHSEQLAREASSRAQEAASKLQSQKISDANNFNERLAERDQQRSKLETQLDDLTSQFKSLQQRYNDLNNSHTRLNTSLTEKQQSFETQFKQLQDNREQLTKEFERLANEVLERKGKAFKEMNQESITTLLNPLQTEMNGFRTRIEAIHTKDAEQRVELRTELKHLQALNREITDQADKLTSALRGQKKVQGNWGELMLENVLDSSGLRLNIDYKREVSFNTEDGRQRPDAIVYLPQKKHLIIDAKTSLIAYTDYVNAEDDVTRDLALAAHTRAVSDRINELADRNYFRLAELNSPEVVIMFIPIESAYVEALRHDDGLFLRAIERNVLVATPTTLLTSLRIVKQLWSFEERNKNTHELANRAQRFYDKLHGFVTSMQGLGSQLDKARDSYDKAFGQLYSGKGNLIKQAAEFKDLGVAVQKEFPAELVERANLELVMVEEERPALTVV